MAVKEKSLMLYNGEIMTDKDGVPLIGFYNSSVGWFAMVINGGTGSYIGSYIQSTTDWTVSVGSLLPDHTVGFYSPTKKTSGAAGAKSLLDLNVEHFEYNPYAPPIPFTNPNLVGTRIDGHLYASSMWMQSYRMDLYFDPVERELYWKGFYRLRVRNTYSGLSAQYPGPDVHAIIKRVCRGSWEAYRDYTIESYVVNVPTYDGISITVSDAVWFSPGYYLNP